MKKFKWHIDGCDEFGFKGWIMDEDALDKSIQINIFVDEKCIATATADIFRTDVLAAGFGNGKYGFLVPIPNEFYNDTEHKFNLGYLGLFIPGAVKTVLLKKKLPVTKGHVDDCNKEKGIIGWVINENNLQESVDIDVFIDDELVTQVTANLFRQDVLDAKGNGNCAFSVPIPEKFWDGIEHSVNIYAVATNTVLKGCPKTFQFSSKFMETIDASIKTDNADIDTLSHQLQELKEENKILFLQLHKIQEKLEQLYVQQQHQLVQNKS